MSYSAPEGTVIGHVHLKVSDVATSFPFYTGILGLDQILHYPTAAFLSTGGYHHHIGMNQWYSRGGKRGTTISGGLAGVTLAITSGTLLADLLARAEQAGVHITQAPGGTTLTDPDGLSIHLMQASTADGTTPISVRSVTLTAANRDGLARFYQSVLGLTATDDGNGEVHLGTASAPDLVVITTGDPSGEREKPSQPGLYHMAILYPTRADLARAVAQMLEANAGFRMAEDHGVSNAVYFVDPENNGIELYWDRPRAEWPRDDSGAISMEGGLLDLTALLTEV